MYDLHLILPSDGKVRQPLIIYKILLRLILIQLNRQLSEISFLETIKREKGHSSYHINFNFKPNNN